jgi:hypothetical protein
MTKLARPRRPTIGKLGRLVINWNDLEIQIRSLLVTLTADVTSAEILTADLETAAMFNALRALAIEYDARRRRLNTRITIDADSKNIKARVYDEAAAHIIHLIDCANRLHDYKEIYLHRTNSIQKSKYIAVNDSKTKTFHELRLPLNLGYDPAQLATQLVNLRRYAAALMRCIIKNENRRSRTQIIWPEEFPLPKAPSESNNAQEFTSMATNFNEPLR